MVKKGDRVKVLNQQDPEKTEYHGQIGTVRYVSCYDPIAIDITMVDGTVVTCNYKTDYARVAKNGDSVKLLKPYFSDHNDKIGKVGITTDVNTESIGISFSDGDYVAADHGCYEVVDEESAKPVNSVKIGDTVKILSVWDDQWDDDIGKVGEVISIYNNGDIDVKVDERGRLICPIATRYEKVEEVPTMSLQNAYKILHKKFIEDNGIKIGSRVTVLRSCKSKENSWGYYTCDCIESGKVIGKTGTVVDDPINNTLIINIDGYCRVFVPWYILRVEPSLVKIQVGSETFEVSEDIAGKIRGIISS